MGDAWREATKKLIDYHGRGSNENGVFQEREVVTLAKVGRSEATARLALTARCWLFGYDYGNATGARCGGPSVWDRRGYKTREAAILGAAQAARHWFDQQITTTNSCVSDKTAAKRSRWSPPSTPITSNPNQQGAAADLFAAFQ